MEPSANPQVFINQVEQNVPPVRKLFNLKIIFAVLGIIVLGAILLGIKSFLFSSGTGSGTSKSVGAKITLESSKQTVSVGEILPVIVKIDTAKRSTDGVDLIIRFDQKVLELKEPDILVGIIYPDYPLKKVDLNSGTLSISAISALLGKGFSGEGIFATINFRAKALGTSAVTIEFIQGQTSESNIVESGTGQDLLQEVKNLEVAVK